jgi:hypothetical protein
MTSQQAAEALQSPAPNPESMPPPAVPLSMSNNGPGWKSNPQEPGVARYWNGRKFTTFTAPLAGPFPEIPEQYREASPTLWERFRSLPSGWQIGLAGVVLVAVGGLVAAAALSAEDDSPPVGRQRVEWSIRLAHWDNERVLFVGDLPDGYPTEARLDGELLEREEDGVFSWDLTQWVPEPVARQREMTCYELGLEVEMWLSLALDSQDEAAFYRMLAYAQHAINRQDTLDC